MILLSFLLMLIGQGAQQPDAAQLALAIVDIARNEAGVTGTYRSTPLASGPFVVDSSTFVDHFDLAYDSTGVDVVQALTSNGYSFGDIAVLKRSSTNPSGAITYWLDGDPMVLNLISLTQSWDEAVARVTIFHTYQKIICARSLELSFTATGNTWTLTERKLVGNC